eukprot:1150312-Pelagomonas_calceolata.AAC.4
MNIAAWSSSMEYQHGAAKSTGAAPPPQQTRSMKATWRKAAVAAGKSAEMQGSSGDGRDRQDCFALEQEWRGFPHNCM